MTSNNSFNIEEATNTIKNDSIIQKLRELQMNLIQKETPKFILKPDFSIEPFYDEKFLSLLSKIEDLIIHRSNQILEPYNLIPKKYE